MLQAIDVARRAGIPVRARRCRDDYYREKIAPHVDGVTVVYQGEADFATKVKLYGDGCMRCFIRFRRASRSGSCRRGDVLRHAVAA